MSDSESPRPAGPRRSRRLAQRKASSGAPPPGSPSPLPPVAFPPSSGLIFLLSPPALPAPSLAPPASPPPAAKPRPSPAQAAASLVRILCIRCVKHCAKAPGSFCVFDMENSITCAYCRAQKSPCRPVSYSGFIFISYQRYPGPYRLGPPGLKDRSVPAPP